MWPIINCLRSAWACSVRADVIIIARPQVGRTHCVRRQASKHYMRPTLEIRGQVRFANSFARASTEDGMVLFGRDVGSDGKVPSW